MPGRHSELEAKAEARACVRGTQLPYFSEVLFAARWIFQIEYLP